MAALLLDWVYCITRVVLRKRMEDIPRKELVWDIAGICTGAIPLAAIDALQ